MLPSTNPNVFGLTGPYYHDIRLLVYLSDLLETQTTCNTQQDSRQQYTHGQLCVFMTISKFREHFVELMLVFAPMSCIYFHNVMSEFSSSAEEKLNIYSNKVSTESPPTFAPPECVRFAIVTITRATLSAFIICCGSANCTALTMPSYPACAPS